MPRALLTDAEALAMSLAEDAINGIDVAERNVHRYAASARVLSSTVKRYTIPIAYAIDGSDAPFELKDAAAAIFAMTLLARRGVSDRDPTYLIVKDRYTAANAWLKQLSDGEDVELVDGEITKGGPLVGHGATSRQSRWSRRALYGGCCAPFCTVTGIDLGDGES